jgi:hypothetical protein
MRANADTLIPDPGDPVSYDRYAYTRNNPVRYTDPSGHGYCDGHMAEDVDCSYTAKVILQQYYNVELNNGNLGDWTADQAIAIYIAVSDVGAKLNLAAGWTATPGDAFKRVYNHLTFLKGNTGAGLTNECQGVESGGCTSSAHMINFASLAGRNHTGYNQLLRNRNNVVHELGHAFNWASKEHGWGNPYDSLDDAMKSNSLLRRGDIPGESYGFASGYGYFLWQMSYTNASSPNEIFADQFLGWTYNTWYTGMDELYINQAEARSAWMENNMGGFLK